ncbi:MAG: shikimate kinase [Candidatus Auribacterota bacterium]|nr:shikimate kinase [Candidatus Auribacterota bacterium]
MRKEKNIVLFGFMGTGKTAVACLLGDRLNFPVVEMDDLIEEREGMSISRIFAEKGERYFRECERELVMELSREGGKIIATGGGVVLNPDNIRDFEKTGIVLCLTARPEVILSRVSNETHRPLLEVENRLEKIEQLLAVRRTFYDRIEYRIDTSDLTIDQVVDQILSQCNRDNKRRYPRKDPSDPTDPTDPTGP